MIYKNMHKISASTFPLNRLLNLKADCFFPCHSLKQHHSFSCLLQDLSVSWVPVILCLFLSSEFWVFGLMLYFPVGEPYFLMEICQYRA